MGPAVLVGVVTRSEQTLLVMVPFITMGSAAPVGIYGTLREHSRVLALVARAFVKTALLWGAVTLLVVQPMVPATASGRWARSR